MGSTTPGAAVVACACAALTAGAAVLAACTTRPPSGAPASAPRADAPRPPATADAEALTPPAPAWPEALAAAFAGRGAPHAQPVALPRDAQGRARWLVFAGTRDVAWGAWRVARAEDGAIELRPVERWPTGVRVAGAVVEGGVAYVLLESAAVLDQPAGLHAVWIDAGGPVSPFEASPMALANVGTVAELASRVRRATAAVPERAADPAGLLAALRAASASTTTLASALAREGADVSIAWQSLFTQRVGHIDAEDGATSLLAGSVLAVMRDAIATQACGLDACEAWTDGARAVVRFVRQDGRWAVASIIEDAPLPRSRAGVSLPRAVPASVGASDVTGASDASDMLALLLRESAREVHRILGEAPLTPEGGTIGAALTDLSPDTPVVAVCEGGAARVFALDAGAVRGESRDGRWDAAFADVDGDGRTDVVLTWSGTGAGGVALSWTQAFLAPPASVQASTLTPDLASALAVMGVRDAGEAARAAASIATRGVTREDACRLLADATTPAGFRKQASADARLLEFDEPGMPTWRPKVIPAARVAVDDLRGLGAHCAELACSATRPYCAWTGGADSEHLWFDWRAGRAQIVGAATYEGE